MSSVDVLLKEHDKFIRSLVAVVFKKYNFLSFVEFDDLYTDAVMAFIRCIDRFDKSRGDFRTYFRVRVVGACVDRVEQLSSSLEGYRKSDGFRPEFIRDFDWDYRLVDWSFGDYVSGDLDKRLIGLNRFHRNIIDLRLFGFDVREIARCCGCHETNITFLLRKLENTKFVSARQDSVYYVKGVRYRKNVCGGCGKFFKFRAKGGRRSYCGEVCRKRFKRGCSLIGKA